MSITETAFLFLLLSLPFLLGLAFVVGMAILLVRILTAVAAAPIDRYVLDEGHRAKWRRNFRRACYAAIACLGIYVIYDAIYPADDFYLSEFREIALRPAPPSTVVLAKMATYPDFHGDYCSSSRMQLSSADYATLLTGLKNDARFSVLSPQQHYSGIAHRLADQVPARKIIVSLTRVIPGEEDHHYAIGFLDDGQSLDVNICVT